ncbi:hypothetical protein D3C87_2163740 [compost metagenome]
MPAGIQQQRVLGFDRSVAIGGRRLGKQALGFIGNWETRLLARFKGGESLTLRVVKHGGDAS